MNCSSLSVGCVGRDMPCLIARGNLVGFLYRQAWAAGGRRRGRGGAADVMGFMRHGWVVARTWLWQRRFLTPTYSILCLTPSAFLFPSTFYLGVQTIKPAALGGNASHRNAAVTHAVLPRRPAVVRRWVKTMPNGDHCVTDSKPWKDRMVNNTHGGTFGAASG